jgi:ferredoxin
MHLHRMNPDRAMSTNGRDPADHASSHRISENGALTEPSRDQAEPGTAEEKHTVVVYDGSTQHEIEVQHGRTLRAALREHNLSPHGWLTRHLNCDGQGHCTACAVDVTEGEEQPEQWLDAFMDAQDLGRLSCQIHVTEDMKVRV